MAEYLVRAKAKAEKLAELAEKLREKAFDEVRPFGAAMSGSLRNAHVDESGTATWEELCYCSPPLKMERAAVLDTYFDEIRTEQVKAGEGWARIEKLPRLFPGMQDSDDSTGG